MSEIQSNEYLGKLLEEALLPFVIEVNGLRDHSSLIMKLVYEVSKKATNNFEEFQKEHMVDVGEGRYKMLIDRFDDFKKIQKSISSSKVAYEVIPKSFLVSLVSQFDAFLSRLLKAMFLIKPELLNASEKTLNFSQLRSFSSIDEARNYILEKEAETFLRKSHSDQFEWMEKRFGLDFRKNLDNWSDFIEITERRNLFVHTNGYVSGQYINVCSENKVSLESGIKIGDQLWVSSKYLKNLLMSLRKYLLRSPICFGENSSPLRHVLLILS